MNSKIENFITEISIKFDIDKKNLYSIWDSHNAFPNLRKDFASKLSREKEQREKIKKEKEKIEKEQREKEEKEKIEKLSDKCDLKEFLDTIYYETENSFFNETENSYTQDIQCELGDQIKNINEKILKEKEKRREEKRKRKEIEKALEKNEARLSEKLREEKRKRKQMEKEIEKTNF